MVSEKNKDNLLLQTYPFKVFKVSKKLSFKKIRENLDKLPSGKFYHEPYPNYFSLELILSSNCNLACKYCFAKESEKGYYGLIKANMPSSVIKKAIDFVFKQLIVSIKKNKSKAGFFDIYFMGGEPLLNKEGLFFAMKYTDQKTKALNKTDRITITTQAAISTNATLLDERTVKFFKQYDFNYVGITVDGETHDQYRVYSNGRGTLKDILKKINLLIKHGVNLKLLSVVPPGEVKNIGKKIDFYKSLGILDKASRISLVPRAPSLAETDRICIMPKKYLAKIQNQLKASYAYSDQEKQLFAEHIIKMAERDNIDERDLDKKMLFMMKVGGCLYHCSAGISKISVTPDGSIYPCHQFVNRRQFYMGNVVSAQKEDYNKVREKFLRRNFDKIDKCKKCVLQSVCPPLVDCPARSYYEEASFYKTPQYCGIYYPYMVKNLEKFIKSL